MIFEAARSTLLAMQGDEKLPSLKTLQAEQAQLFEEQERLYAERNRFKKEAKQIETIKSNIDTFPVSYTHLDVYKRQAYQISGKLFADIAAYIDDRYVDEHTDNRSERLRRMNAFRKEEMCIRDRITPLSHQIRRGRLAPSLSTSSITGTYAFLYCVAISVFLTPVPSYRCMPVSYTHLESSSFIRS